MGGFETQRAFNRVQEHPKRTSDEDVMTVRSWMTQPENPVRRTSRGLLFSIIFGHNLGSSCINIYIWVDSRLKGLSIESNNTQNGLWTKKLWLSEAGGHNQKICSKEQCHPGCCTPCVLMLHFGLISEPKGFGIWIYLFQGDMFSYESSLPKFESLNSYE